METTIKNGKSAAALTGMIFAIVSLVLSPIPIINNLAILLAIVALICGVVALVQSKHRKKRGDYKIPVTIVLAIISIIIVFVSQAFYVDMLDRAVKAANSALSENTDKMTGDKTEDLFKNDITVKMSTFTATTDSYGITTTTLPVTVTNKNSETKSYTIQIEAVNAKGDRIADDTVYANDLGAGQKQNFKAFEFVDSEKAEALKTAKFKLVSVTQS